MNPKTVTYQRIKNLGNYESERLEVTVEVDDDENHLEVAQRLRAEVTDLLFPPKPKSAEVEEINF